MACYTMSKKEYGGIMYYGLIMLSVMMFGGCFALNDVYRKMRGSSFKISLQHTLVGGITGIIVLVAINGLKLEFTPFTLIIASLAALNGIAFAVGLAKIFSDKCNLFHDKTSPALVRIALMIPAMLARMDMPTTIPKSSHKSLVTSTTRRGKCGYTHCPKNLAIPNARTPMASDCCSIKPIITLFLAPISFSIAIEWSLSKVRV